MFRYFYVAIAIMAMLSIGVAAGSTSHDVVATSTYIMSDATMGVMTMVKTITAQTTLAPGSVATSITTTTQAAVTTTLQVSVVAIQASSSGLCDGHVKDTVQSCTSIINVGTSTTTSGSPTSTVFHKDPALQTSAAISKHQLIPHIYKRNAVIDWFNNVGAAIKACFVKLGQQLSSIGHSDEAEY